MPMPLHPWLMSIFSVVFAILSLLAMVNSFKSKRKFPAVIQALGVIIFAVSAYVVTLI